MRGEVQGREEDHRLLGRAGRRVLGDLALHLPLLLAVLGAAGAQVGKFAEVHRMLPADSDPTRAVAMGDLDGDGDRDVVVGNYGQQNRLYLGDGSGSFVDVTAAGLPPHQDHTSTLALGDVDGDGDLDLLVGNRGLLPPYEQDRLYLNSGSAIFSEVTGTHLPASSSETTCLALGDVDADGDLDAVIGIFGQCLLWANDGTGIFTDASGTHMPGSNCYSQGVALADLDGDGDLDAMVATYGQNRLFLNGGGGAFTDATAARMPADQSSTACLALADIDGDGDLDAFLGSYGTVAFPTPNHLYFNDGTGTFTLAMAQPPPIPVMQTLAASFLDADSDGDQDLMIACWSDSNRLYVNDGTGVLSDVTVTHLTTIPDRTTALATGDLDADGDVDVLCGNDMQQNRLLLNDATGPYTDARPPSLPFEFTSSSRFAVGDLDGDADLDLLVANWWQNRLHLNDGTSFFSDATSTHLPGAPDASTSLAVGDVDSDGDLDVLFGNGAGGASAQNKLYLNGGSGVFNDVTSSYLPPVIDMTHAVAFGDLDGDGDLDALAGNFGERTRLYLNGGGGIYSEVNTLPVLINATSSLALGDVDGDGDTDVLLGNDYAEQNRLLLNNGSAVLSDVTAAQMPVFLDSTGDVALGDVDGDGDLDAVTANTTGNRLYLNGGTGSFVDATSTSLPGAGSGITGAIALRDMDADGDLDILMANMGASGFGAANRLYVNDGSGVFTDGTPQNLLSDLDRSGVLAVADFDGDGDQDALFGNLLQQDRLYTNLTRQLSWRAIPRFGRPLTLEIHGPPNEGWVLLGSIGTTSIPLPPWGTLRLDPQHLVIMELGALDSQGRGTLTYAIPPNPGGLAGLTVWCQAAVGLSPRLTNLERFTFTDL